MYIGQSIAPTDILALILKTKSVYVAGIDEKVTDAALDDKTFELIKV